MMTNTELRRHRSKARKACLASLRKLAKNNGLRTQRVAGEAIAGDSTNAGFAIGCAVGLGSNILAGTVIMGRNGYISCFPHGEDYHTMLRRRNDAPGYASRKDWEEFAQKPVLGYVDFAHGTALFADNFDPTDDEDVRSILETLEISKESCEWGRERAR
jgi:hypothetical protein